MPRYLTLLGGVAGGSSSAPAGFPSLGPSVAALGDSITDNNGKASASFKYKYNRGYINEFNMLAGQPFDFQLENNFGVSGNRMSQMLERVPNVIAAKPAAVFLCPGTNDITDNRVFSGAGGLKEGLLNLVKPINGAGIPIILSTIPPRNGAPAFSASQKKTKARYDDYMRELPYLASLMADAGLTGGRPIITVDPHRYLMDYATGDSWAADFPDGLHPGPSGAWWWGKAMAEDLALILPPQAIGGIEHGDAYDATYNPTGNLLYSGATNYGLLAGTGGTKVASTGMTPTGDVADGMSAARVIGTSTATMVCAKENPRTDPGYRSGERQRVTIAANSGGGADECYDIYRQNVGSGNLNVGDLVYGQFDFEVVGTPQNFLGVECNLSNGAQNWADGGYASNSGLTYQGAFKGRRRTPVMALTTTNAITLRMRVHLKTDTGNAAAEVLFSNLKIKKVMA